MRMTTSIVNFLFFLSLILILQPVALAQSPQETLTQYIADLQKNPNDSALREKIIKYVQTMSPAPKIPAEVDELVGQAKYAIKYAKGQKDYLDAVDAYKKVLTIAPWIGVYYYNLGIAQEQAGQFEDAIKNFNLYLLTSPDAKDAIEARERIGGLKYAAKKAERAPSQPPVAEVKRDPFEDLLRKIDGRRYLSAPVSGDRAVIDVRGRLFVLGTIIKGIYYESGAGTTPSSPIEIRGRETIVPIRHSIFTAWVSNTYIISEDGDRITVSARYADGDVREYIHRWKR